MTADNSMATQEFSARPEPVLPERFFWLDFLRFVAAMAVMVHHYYFFYLDGDTLPVPLSDLPALFPLPAVGFFFDYGQYAVQFFWVLSGFVFAHTYFRKPSDGFGFAVARFARLYPLHFATLLLTLALQTASMHLTGSSQVIGNNDAYHFLLQTFLVSAWGLEHGTSYNAPIWSVSAEIGAYFVFFVMHRNLLFKTVAGQAFAIMAAIGFTWISGPSAVILCAAFFFAGCLTYLLVQKRRAVDFAFAALLVLYALKFPEALMQIDTPMTHWVALFALIVFAVAWMDILRVPGGRKFGALGDITYSIYLIHFPVIVTTLIALKLLGVTDRSFLSNPLTLGLYMVTVVILSVISYRLYERPVDRVIRRFAMAQRNRAPQTEKGVQPV